MDQTSAASSEVSFGSSDDGFVGFYEAEHTSAVRRMALITGSVAAAEDVVHDAMVEVYQRWGSVERPAAYLHRCCVNGSHRWLRRRRREPSTDQDLEPGPELDEALVEVIGQLEVLTVRQRTAVVLRYLDGLTEAEIAAAMSCRPGSVGPLLSRAKTTLRREWTT